MCPSGRPCPDSAAAAKGWWAEAKLLGTDIVSDLTAEQKKAAVIELQRQGKSVALIAGGSDDFLAAEAADLGNRCSCDSIWHTDRLITRHG